MAFDESFLIQDLYKTRTFSLVLRINFTMEGESKWRPKYRKINTEVDQCYLKRHEGERRTEITSTTPENIENENSMPRPQIGKRPKKNKFKYNVFVPLQLVHMIHLAIDYGFEGQLRRCRRGLGSCFVTAHINDGWSWGIRHLSVFSTGVVTIRCTSQSDGAVSTLVLVYATIT